MPIEITPAALKAIKDFLKTHDKAIRENLGLPPDSELGLRIIFRGFCCAGTEYALMPDMERYDDEAYELDGLKVFILKKQLQYIEGSKIDYANNEIQFNPPEKSDCCEKNQCQSPCDSCPENE